MFSNIRVTLEMIKIEHTLFALPFALLGALLAARGVPTAWQLIWITVAMVGARSTAMAFNRIADREYDARNPRTSMRAIPAGLLSVHFVWLFTIVAAVMFFVAAAMLNRLTLLLAPVALASVLLYSFTKRWTSLAHLVLGWCLSIAPTGAWIAVRGAIDSPVLLLLSLVVLLWTPAAVLYACQDFSDRTESAFDSGTFRHQPLALDLAHCTQERSAPWLRYTWFSQPGRFALEF
jgi:4-hydroxybenzoate polyprenyltransferase